MAKIVIDGTTYEANPEHNLLQECLSAGLDLPYFCWHPSMGSVGACRQCAVKQYRNAEDKTGTLVMACMTPAAAGSIISIADEQARKFRASVIESLMISHPHDCPVCEEGGECHLQDMTLMSGHNYRRYDHKKVTHRNQYLGPFIRHEMNRCITCYRCVRYYNDYAGGTDLSAQASHHHVYFGRHQEGTLESEFSGNLVEVCPTGVFTDATFSAHYTRVWDLQTAPSVCVGCAVGCNTTPGERYGSLRRLVNRYNSEVNGYFLCDRGRFGYGFVNSEKRIEQSFVRENNVERVLEKTEATTRLQAAASGTRLAIGSPRASVEANFALMQLVGKDNFYSGCSATEFALLQSVLSARNDPQLHFPSIREIEQADAVLIVGEDVTNTAPRIALALRQASHNRARDLARAARIPDWHDAAVRELAQQEKTPFYILSGYASRLADVATGQTIDAPDTLADIATAIAKQIDNTVPANDTGLDSEILALAAQISEVLLSAKRPLIVTGVSDGSQAMLNAAINIAKALANKSKALEVERVALCCVVPEVNSLGLALLTAGSENSLDNALAKMHNCEVGNVIVLENDLYRRASKGAVESALAAVKNLLVIDHVSTATTAQAHCVLASTTFAEQQGSYINYEGRAQLSFQVYQKQQQAQPASAWLAALLDGSPSPEQLTRNCAGSVAGFGKLEKILPDRSRYIAGMQVPRQTPRYSGRTAMFADRNVHEAQQAQDSESVMAFSMEGVSPLKDASILATPWSPGWNSNQSISKFQDEVGGKLAQGNSGELLEESTAQPRDYYPLIASVQVSKGTFKVIRAFHIFGSDELSALATPVQERTPPAYAALSAADADAGGFGRSSTITVSSGDYRIDLPLLVREKVKPGTVVIYAGDDSCDYFRLRGQVALSVSAKKGSNPEMARVIVSDRRDED